MKHYLEQQYFQVKSRYLKFSHKLEKALANPSETKGRRIHQLVQQVNRFKTKLLRWEHKLKLAGLGITMGLTLMVGEAKAQAPVFEYNLGISHQNRLYTKPALADIDADGDLDAFVTHAFQLHYYENIGTAEQAKFQHLDDFFGFNVATPSTATLADFDGDGDLDILTAPEGNIFNYFENTGNNTNPTFAAKVDNPFGLSGPGSFSTLTAIDIDNDGDLDVFSGDSQGNIRFFENTGDHTNPTFATSVNNSFGLDGQGLKYASPSFVDIDNDGDLDGIINYQDNNSSFDSNIYYFENTGNNTNPTFASGVVNTFGIPPMESFFGTAFGDLDNDGDLDGLIGDGGGLASYFENTGSNTAPAFTSDYRNPFGLPYATGEYVKPFFADIDGDGDFDAFYEDENASFQFVENTGDSSTPAFSTIVSDPFGASGNGQGMFLTDIDNDGDLDLFLGASNGDFNYQENTGNQTTPAFAASQTNPFGLSNVGKAPLSNFIDLDGDGDLDLSAIASDGTMHYFANTGNVSAPAFATVSLNPFGSFALSENVYVSRFADLDLDGDLDLFITDFDGTPHYFENTGTANSPTFAAAVSKAFDLPSTGFYTAYAFTDIDGDGDLDIFSGEWFGSVNFIENKSFAPVISSSFTTITNQSPFQITITFPQEVTGFELSDLVVSNGAASNLQSSDNKVFTADITPTTEGTVTVDIPAMAAMNSAGGENFAAQQFSIIYEESVTSLENSLATKGVSIFSYGSSISIKFLDAQSAKAKINIYDLNGKQIALFDNQSNLVHKIELPHKGVYVVRVTNKYGLAVRKVFVE